MSLGKLSKSKVQGLEAEHRKAAVGTRRLTLVRHAKSDWSLPGQQDWDRVLNKRGQQDAPEMARRLRSRKLKPDLMLSSPAVRALTTASVMARELRVPAERIAADERLYLADPAAIVQPESFREPLPPWQKQIITKPWVSAGPLTRRS